MALYRVKKQSALIPGQKEGAVIEVHDDALVSQLGDAIELHTDEKLSGLPTIPISPRDVPRVTVRTDGTARETVTPSTLAHQPTKGDSPSSLKQRDTQRVELAAPTKQRAPGPVSAARHESGPLGAGARGDGETRASHDTEPLGREARESSAELRSVAQPAGGRPDVKGGTTEAKVGDKGSAHQKRSKD